MGHQFKDVYKRQAFYILTNGEIKNLYTKETFRYTEEEQAFAYLTKKCQTERIPLHYHESLKIAQQFNLCDLLYRLNVGMGEHYQSILQYEVSTNYFMKAIHVANGIHCNLAYCYHQLGCLLYTSMRFIVLVIVLMIYR